MIMNANETSSPFIIISAEDDEDYFHLLNMILTRELKVQKVIHVSDGEQLVQHLAKIVDSEQINGASWPGLVLLDLNMPKKNGIDALKEIRANPKIPQIPIVIFTVSGDPLDVNKCYTSGANAFITKPTELKDLIDTLGSAINYWKNLQKKTPAGVV